MRLFEMTRSLPLLAAVAAFIPTANAQSSQVPSAVLTVNDTDPVGSAVGPLLSLDGAIRLANGTLSVDQLSAAARAQVKGNPGANSHDIIQLPQGAVMTVPENVRISALVGNDGDTIEGNGALLISGKDETGTLLTISSSDFTLRNFHARGFLTTVTVDFGGRNLKNITLDRLRLTGAPFLSALLTIGASTSNGSLHGISVVDSVFDAGREVVRGNLVFIAAAKNPQLAPTAQDPQPGGTVDNVELDGVRLVRNWFSGGGLGLYLNGSLGGGSTTNAVTRNVVLADNVFIGQHDAAVNFLGGLPAAGGRHTKAVLENVVASGNRLETPNWGFYMGNENFGGWQGHPGSMHDSVFRNITIEKNTITKNANGAVGHCVSFENSADFGGDQSSGNLMENVTIADNDISGCVELSRSGQPPLKLGTAIYVNAGRASLGAGRAGGTANANVARNIVIINNRIKNSTRGIVVNGGYARYTGKDANSSKAQDNRLTGLRIEGNQLDNTDTGIRLTGGDGVDGSTITGNSVTGVQIRNNRITRSQVPCETIANAGTATGNTLAAACPSGRR